MAAPLGNKNAIKHDGRCAHCGGTEFYYKKNGWQSACKACNNARSMAQYRADPEAWKRRVRDNELKRKYGISREEYEVLISKGCGICGGTNKLHVDHDHKTGKVRGALCASCNRGLGMFKDSPALLQAAVEYLREVMPYVIR